MPAKAYVRDSGFDISYCGDEEVVILRGHRKTLPCGFSLGIPEGFEVQIRSRSGLAAKNGIMVLNSPGTVDSSYTGEIKVVLYNSDISDYVVKPGDRIAQMVVAEVPLVGLELADDIEQTDRGSDGFGSTGVE